MSTVLVKGTAIFIYFYQKGIDHGCTGAPYYMAPHAGSPLFWPLLVLCVTQKLFVYAVRPLVLPNSACMW